MLGVPDAYELPPVPGSAYLQDRTPTTLHAVQGRVRLRRLPPRPRRDGAARRRLFRRRSCRSRSPRAPAPSRPRRPRAEPPEPDEARPTGETVMDVDARRGSTGKGPAAHQIWLPPLAEPPTLDQLLPAADATTETAACARPAGPATARLTVPVAHRGQAVRAAPRPAVGRPVRRGRARRAWSGAPQSGKSTLLRTLVCRARAHPHPARGAVLPARLRRRRAVHAGRPAARRRRAPAGSTRSACRRIVAEVDRAARRAGAGCSPSTASTRWPRSGATRRAERPTAAASATCSSSSTAG